MSQSAVERKLMDVSQRLRKVKDELAVADEQLQALSGTAEEARIRSLVSETPLAAKESQEAQRNADAMASARGALAQKAERLSAELDELLDKLVLGSGN